MKTELATGQIIEFPQMHHDNVDFKDAIARIAYALANMRPSEISDVVELVEMFAEDSSRTNAD